MQLCEGEMIKYGIKYTVKNCMCKFTQNVWQHINNTMCVNLQHTICKFTYFKVKIYPYYFVNLTINIG